MVKLLKVVGEGGGGDLQPIAQLADAEARRLIQAAVGSRSAAVHQPVEELQPVGVAQGFEHNGQGVGLIVRHVSKCRGLPLFGQAPIFLAVSSFAKGGGTSPLCVLKVADGQTDKYNTAE